MSPGVMDETVRAYDLDAAAYVGRTAQLPDDVRAAIEDCAARLGAGAMVLEIGSGGGRDARRLEELGLTVRRTDITPAIADLPTVLSRLAAVTRAGGLLRASVKEGDGDGWSTHGSIGRRRHFTYWRAPALAEVVAEAGWTDVEVRSGTEGERGESWLWLEAVRR